MVPVRLAGAGRTEIDLLAAQILKRLDVIARQNVQFRDRHPDHVLNAALKIGRFALGAKIFEHVGLGDRRVDATQVQQIVEIGRRAIRYDRQNPQVVAVV